LATPEHGHRRREGREIALDRNLRFAWHHPGADLGRDGFKMHAERIDAGLAHAREPSIGVGRFALTLNRQIDRLLYRVRALGKDGGAAVAFGGDFLAGYAPGTIPDILKPGQVKLLKAGSDIVFQLHYTANGTPGSDKSKVGVIFAKDQPKERVLTLAAANGEFAIPPGDGNYRVDSKITLQADSTLESLLPHMHLRGKSFEYRVIYPSGETETLLSVPHYSFSWQLTYYLDKPKVLPKGTVIECTAYFDNSANNGNNPDPTKEIKFGEQSWDEMMIGFFDVSVPLNVTTMDLMRPPKAAPKKDSGGAE
jgi:hypothetical protein